MYGVVMDAMVARVDSLAVVVVMGSVLIADSPSLSVDACCRGEGKGGCALAAVVRGGNEKEGGGKVSSCYSMRAFA